MGAGVDVWLGARAHPRSRREDDRREQDNGGVETQQRRNTSGDHEDERQQTLRASPRAARHDRAHRLKQPRAASTLSDQQQRRQETNRRRELPQSTACARQSERTDRHERRCQAHLVTGPVSFTAAERVRATLARRGVVYVAAVQSHDGRRLVLYVRRRLVPGRYTLTLTAGQRRITTRAITLR